MLKQIYFIRFSLLMPLLILMLASCVRQSNFPAGKKLICDAEKRTAKGDSFIAKNDSTAFFAGGWFRTAKEAYSGKHSVLTVPKTKAFAFAYTIKNAGPDWVFKVSVWRKSKDGKGSLVVASNNTDELYLATADAVETSRDGWERLELDIYTPPYFDGQDIKFYVWNNGSDSVYFDDLSIHRYKKAHYPDYQEEPFSIMLDTSDYMKIVSKRKEAFANGILQTSDDDWVRGIVFGGGEIMKVRMRLKGDWLDHLWGDKWSFRIKMRKDHSWNRLRTFSVQTPASRAYLMEWVAHEYYQSKDVLTTRYGFIPLQLNNENRGLYAWEEHFVKQLLEWRNRREGPIVKFTEDAFWQIQKININEKKWPVFPYYEASVIKPFGVNRTIKNPVLYQQYLQAQKLMFQFKHGLKKPAEIFDLEKMATYYAMLDLTHARHGMTWHNQRFYFNPIIAKLEPIAFDGYTDHLDIDLSIEDNFAYKIFILKEIKGAEKLHYSLFTDSLFLTTYLDKLKEVSNEDYINSMYAEISEDRFHYDSLLKLEFPYVDYDHELIRKSAAALRSYLPELEKLLDPWVNNDVLSIPVYAEQYSDTSVYENTPEYFLNAYVEDHYVDSLMLSVHNYYSRDLILLGSGPDNRHVTHYFADQPKIGAYHEGMLGERLDVKVDSSARYLFFMFPERFNTYVVAINPWPYPRGITPQQELSQMINLSDNPMIDKIIGHKIFIKKDSLVVDKPMVFPGGYELIFEEGTVLNMLNQSLFLSYSPVKMHGTSDEPIHITSSDYSANGFTVLQAREKSVVNHVKFSNLNTLDYNHWTLTGAVNFYESDVHFNGCEFYRNQCEDALNVIRSTFDLNHSEFSFIQSDAFDSDFSKGRVSNTTFSNIGNDAIDFSGSDILIIDTEISDAQDKGISGGEESHLLVSNVRIVRANIGIASKDLSVVEVVDSQIIDCNYGLVLLRKKPEYGPAQMLINSSHIVNPKQEHLIEKGSIVHWDGKRIEGEAKNVGELFY